MSATMERVRWPVRKYFRLVETGMIDGRVELLNGEIIKMAAQGQLHMQSVTATAAALLGMFNRDRFWVAVQGTLRLTKYDAPDPDFQVLPVPFGTRGDDLPKPILVIEISDTTYAKDHGVKLRLYARSGIEDYWIVNLNEDRVEVYRGPVDATGRRRDCRYEECSVFERGQSIALLAEPDVSIAVDDLLPPMPAE